MEGKLGPLGVDFALPPEATAAGKVIQLFEGPAAGQPAYCPTALDEQPHRTACRVTFRGTITLTKVDPFGGGGTTGTTPTPANQPAGPARPGTTTPPRAGTGTAPGRPSVPKGRARLQAGGRSVAVRVTCPGACSGTATFRVPARGTKAGRKLAAVRVRVPKRSGTRTVRVPVPRAARAALRRTPDATVVLALRGATGPATTATLRIAR
ncbi:hypothetical protein [Patulibacter minatonensis]|uniref:hypothetical protein n=1 Tax=Patulibacter minatonensis TaxID=298163 RepID=UPI00047AD0F5|nr:hypothetical protein [Patulibacter minatonensis]